MGGEDEHGECSAVLDQPGGQLAVQAEAGAGVGGQYHAYGEDEHEQLGATPAAGHRGRAAGHLLCPGTGVGRDGGHQDAPCCGQ